MKVTVPLDELNEAPATAFETGYLEGCADADAERPEPVAKVCQMPSRCCHG